MPVNIVLYQPEIPPNTGNIIRLCANTGANLHLIKPLGFEWDDKRLRRAGLDYHKLTHVTLWDSLQDCLNSIDATNIYACTTKGKRSHVEPTYQPGDVFLFGPETRGLPDNILQTFDPQSLIRIPMVPESRSLNLANSVTVVLYEAWRQLDFIGKLP